MLTVSCPKAAPHLYKKRVIPAANRAPMPRAPDTLKEATPALPVLWLVDELLVEEPLELPEPADVPELLVDPSVPFDGLEAGARFLEASAASFTKLSRERVAFLVVFSLITITIPFWQCIA